MRDFVIIYPFHCDVGSVVLPISAVQRLFKESGDLRGGDLVGIAPVRVNESERLPISRRDFKSLKEKKPLFRCMLHAQASHQLAVRKTCYGLGIRGTKVTSIGYDTFPVF